MLGVLNGGLDVVELLLASEGGGGKESSSAQRPRARLLDAADERGWTALHYASVTDESCSIINLLCRSGANMELCVPGPEVIA